MIKPTIGRIVLFTPDKNDHILGKSDQKMAAIVTYVWSDTMVNLSVFSPNGVSHGRQSVPLIQDENKPDAFFCEWMKYQKGQASKTEQLEKEIKDAKKAG
jgi:hypothetical protein